MLALPTTPMALTSEVSASLFNASLCFCDGLMIKGIAHNNGAMAIKLVPK